MERGRPPEAMADLRALLTSLASAHGDEDSLAAGLARAMEPRFGSPVNE
ncbi:hypothetical protein STENM223S_02446 [Streptomyces tendae]